MKKIYILLFITALTAIFAVVYGFSLTGSPAQARDAKFDKERVNDLSDISYEIISYANSQKQLPDSIADLELSEDMSDKDPDTKTPYVYTKVDEDSYTLCATFKTDTRDPKSKAFSAYESSEFRHPIGYYCFEKKVAIYNANPETEYSNTPVVAPARACSGNYCIACNPNQCGAGRLSGGGCEWSKDFNTCEASIQGAVIGEACYYDYQCQSNVCSNKVCKTGSVIPTSTPQ